MSNKQNIFMIGLNDFNREKLKSIANFDHYSFYGLIPPEEAEDADQYDVETMLQNLDKQLTEFDGSIDAIVTYIDFPISMITPILCKKYNRPSASLESILKCHHKYWSRVEQAKVVPDHVPKFNKVDPFDENPIEQVDLKYPFWLKPVKSVGSYLGFRVENKKQFNEYIEVIREHIGRMSEPFNDVLKKADLPPEIESMDGHYCIAEQIIGGRQCTLEGYVHNGEVKLHGVVDSIRHANKSTFSRYVYPSKLPRQVQDRMYDITQKVLNHIGYDNLAFNVEFFWNKSKDKIWLLEVNTRVSQSHSDLFEKVDGASNHQITVEVGLGNEPKFPSRKGKFNKSAKFFYRKWEDAVVSRIPTQVEVEEIQQAIPGTLIDIKVDEGIQLSEMNEQDSYSFELAWLFIGGKDENDLKAKFDECVKRLPFEFKPVSNPEPVGVVEGYEKLENKLMGKEEEPLKEILNNEK